MISLGSLPGTACDSLLPIPLPRQAVALIPRSQTHARQPSFTVHSYRVYKVIANTHNTAWVSYDVPQLGIQIALHGTGSRRILDTLAPSARVIALDSSNDIIASNGHSVSNNGISLSIPSSWVVATPSNTGCGWPSSYPTNEPELLFINADVSILHCPLLRLTPAKAAHDGVSVYLPPHNRYAPTRSGKPIATLQHGTTTVTVYAEQYDPNTLDLYVRKTGSTITHFLTLGLGRDGRVAGGVLASVRAVT